MAYNTTTGSRRNKADAGNVGINIGVAAPMTFYPFSGWNESFLVIYMVRDGMELNSIPRPKVVAERWPRDWSRQF